jgi:hypothetical protein
VQLIADMCLIYRRSIMHHDCSRVGAVLTIKRSFSHIFAFFLSENCTCIWGCAWGSKYSPVHLIAYMCLIYRRSILHHDSSRVGAILIMQRSFSHIFAWFSANSTCIWGCAWGSKYSPVHPIANMCLIKRRSIMHHDCSRVGAVLLMKRSFSHIFACFFQWKLHLYLRLRMGI